MTRKSKSLLLNMILMLTLYSKCQRDFVLNDEVSQFHNSHESRTIKNSDLQNLSVAKS